MFKLFGIRGKNIDKKHIPNDEIRPNSVRF